MQGRGHVRRFMLSTAKAREGVGYTWENVAEVAVHDWEHTGVPDLTLHFWLLQRGVAASSSARLPTSGRSSSASPAPGATSP